MNPKRFFRDLPIKQKLLLIILLTSLAALLLSAGAFTTYDVFAFKRGMVANLNSTARMVGFNSASSLAFDETGSAEETLQALREQPRIVSAAIYNQEGQLFAIYRRDTSGGHIPPEVGASGDTFTSDSLELFHPIRLSGEVIGTVFLRSDLADLYARWKNYAWIVGAVLLLAIFIAGIIASRIQRVISTPITQLASTVGRITKEQDFTTRAVKTSDDELGRLIDGFNEMLTQIQERDGKLQTAYGTLEQRVHERTESLRREINERKLAENGLESSLSVLHASLESTIDAILVVDLEGHETAHNQNFINMWGFAEARIFAGNDTRVLSDGSLLTKAPEAFVQRVKEIYEKPEEETFDVLEFKDGRIIERYSQPQRVGPTTVGRVWCFRDVTERKQAELELANSLSTINATLDSTLDGIMVLDREGHVKHINRQFCELFDMSAEFIRSGNNRQVFARGANMMKDPKAFIKRALHLHASPEDESYDEIELKDGRVYERYTRSQNFDGVSAGRVWAYRDITERKRADDKLANSLSVINATLESSLDGIVVIDLGGEVKHFNRRFAEMWNIPVEELSIPGNRRLLSKCAMYLQDPKAFLRRTLKLHNDLTEESMDIVEFKDGRVYEVYSRPQQNDGASTGRVWTYRDITERKRSEETLTYERDLLQALLDSLPDRLYFKDNQSRFVRMSLSSVEGILITLRRQYREEHSEDTSESFPPHLQSIETLRPWLLGKSDLEILPEATARPLIEEELKVMKTGQPILGKIIASKQADGSTFWSLNSKMPWRNAQGEIIGTYGMNQNITAIKEAEYKLNAAHEELIAASRQAGMAEVATGVLHNVGNVLNSVNVSATVVRDALHGSKIPTLGRAAGLMKDHHADMDTYLTTDPKGKLIPSFVIQLADHLAKEHALLTSEHETLSRNIEHIKEIVAMQQNYAKVSGVYEKVRIADLLGDALQMQVASLANHGIEVVRHYEELPPVLVDKHRVMQILVNLVQNAKYAVKESGRTDGQIELSIAQISEQRIRVTVSDNGMGISPENLTKIFSHGFTTRQDGHGFGLHSGANAAKEMGGALHVSSPGTGLGATFTLEVPLKTEAPS